MVYGTMSFLPNPTPLLGLVAPSCTQSASGSPVMMGTRTPLPGRSIWGTSCMNALSYLAVCQISAWVSGVRSRPSLFRVMDGSAMMTPFDYFFVWFCAGHQYPAFSMALAKSSAGDGFAVPPAWLLRARSRRS